EQRGLAGAVGPDDDAQLAARDRKVERVERGEAAEADGDFLHLQDVLGERLRLDTHDLTLDVRRCAAAALAWIGPSRRSFAANRGPLRAGTRRPRRTDRRG